MGVVPAWGGQFSAPLPVPTTSCLFVDAVHYVFIFPLVHGHFVQSRPIGHGVYVPAEVLERECPSGDAGERVSVAVSQRRGWGEEGTERESRRERWSM